MRCLGPFLVLAVLAVAPSCAAVGPTGSEAREALETLAAPAPGVPGRPGVPGVPGVLGVLGAPRASSIPAPPRPRSNGPRIFGYGFTLGDLESIGSAGGTFETRESVSLDGWGAEFDFGGTQVFGWQRREYESSAESDELYIGYLDFVAESVYFLFAARYALDLEFANGASTGGIWGWALGGGLRFDVGGPFSLEFRYLYEDFLSEATASGEDFELEGWVGTFGVGFQL